MDNYRRAEDFPGIQPYSTHRDPGYHRREAAGWCEKHKGEYPYVGFDLANVAKTEWELYKKNGFERHPIAEEVKSELEKRNPNLN